MANLIFELGSEGLPGDYVHASNQVLAGLMAEKLKAVQLEFEQIRSFATPRRLAVLVEGLMSTSTASYQRKRGPSQADAFDADNQPTQAARSFAASQGVDVSMLYVDETAKGAYMFAFVQQGGEPTQQLLPQLLADLVEELPATRKMRWGRHDFAFVRPIAWLLALLDQQVIEVELAGVKAGNVTYGHRLLAPDPIELNRPEDYPKVLEAAYVIASLERRRERTWQAALEVSEGRNLNPKHNRHLLNDITNLVEYPVAIVGSFDSSFLSLPSKVLETVMTHHQRLLSLRDGRGKLAPHFIGIANNRVPNEQVIRKGYENVLAGHLADAQFFWEADLDKSLAQHAWGLSGVSFHKDLGSMADKVTRIEVGAGLIADALELPAEQRAVLAKALPIFRADLNTQMVAAFPELEGVMACAYAKVEGYEDDVANALEHGVRPQIASSLLPSSAIGVLLAVCDRLDTLLGLFALDKRPSGSADPFKLRRHANALARILNVSGWHLSLRQCIDIVTEAFVASGVDIDPETMLSTEAFVWNRVTSLLQEEGISADIIRATTYDTPPIINAARRAHLLLALRQYPAFQTLLAVYKRAANLSQDGEASTTLNPKRFKSDYEHALYNALAQAQTTLTELITMARQVLTPWDLGRGPSATFEHLDESLEGLLTLQAPLEAFLDNVHVNVNNDKLRLNRLALLHSVCDTLGTLGALEELNITELADGPLETASDV
ncbi:MAG: glycine--tRNA ligase subunit beta [Deinococcota bacterium]